MFSYYKFSFPILIPECYDHHSLWISGAGWCTTGFNASA